jgi:signal peptidase I
METDPSTEVGEPSSPRRLLDMRRSRPWRAWLRTLLLAFLTALAIRTCAFEPYQIPSESMEGTLLVGDFLLVSKLHYGPRLPATIGVPFVRGRLPTGLPSARLPGFSSVQRADVVVFNYPPHAGPLDGRMPFIKRVVGLPGDTVLVRGKLVMVNGVRVASPPGGRQLWRVRLARGADLVSDSLDAIDARERGGHGRERLVEAPIDGAARLVALAGVERVSPYIRPDGDGSARFPPGAEFSLDHYGPVIVPRRGQTVPLDGSTWPLYREAIAREAAAARVEGPRRRMNEFIVGGAPVTRYTFREDHFFVMGDNRDDSADSRTWGFVPASFLIGKAVVVYFSWDAEAGRPRWGRAMRGIE